LPYVLGINNLFLCETLKRLYYEEAVMSLRKWLMRGFVLLLCLSACNLPSQDASEAPLPPTELPPPTEAPVPPEDVPEVPAVEAGVVHVSMPDQGSEKFQVVPDQESRNTAPDKQANGGDAYGNGRFERPFTAEEMEYLPYIDINQAEMLIDEEGGWIYASIVLAESLSLGMERQFHYGFELDLNLDGRGDVLVIVEKPDGEEWTTDGVQVWKDVNEDVGGKTAIKPDESAGGDGYEVLLFDAGVGGDADLAWVRRSAEEKEKIEFAFKLGLAAIGEAKPVFLWGAWAFEGEVHPELFDIQDHITLEEAGSPLRDNAYYPVQAFSAADNTCRGLLGMVPTGQLPGMCFVSSSENTGEGSAGPIFHFGGDVTTEICVPIDCDPWDDMGMVWDPETCSCVDE
jgi:CXCXC repeat